MHKLRINFTNALEALTLYLVETNRPLVKRPAFEIALDVQKFFAIHG